MRKWINLIENHQPKVGDTLLITNLYDTNELQDESESLGHCCPPMNWDDPLVLREMSAEEAKTTIMATKSLTLWEAFEQDATKKQKAIVARKAKAFDRDRIVVLEDNYIIDGNHHVIAAIMTGNPVKYVDLTDWS